jgi:hypothetical protein
VSALARWVAPDAALPMVVPLAFSQPAGAVVRANACTRPGPPVTTTMACSSWVRSAPLGTNPPARITFRISSCTPLHHDGDSMVASSPAPGLPAWKPCLVAPKRSTALFSVWMQSMYRQLTKLMKALPMRLSTLRR